MFRDEMGEIAWFDIIKAKASEKEPEVFKNTNPITLSQMASTQKVRWLYLENSVFVEKY